MKYSAHKINVRSIRKMAVGETMLVKHGKRVEYKGGVTIVPKHYESGLSLYRDSEVMDAVRQWTESFDDCKSTVIVVTCTYPGRYDAYIGEHFSTRDNQNYQFYVNQLGHKEIKV